MGVSRLLQGDQDSGQQLLPVPLPLLRQSLQPSLGGALLVPQTFVLHLGDNEHREDAVGTCDGMTQVLLDVHFTSSGGGYEGRGMQVGAAPP